ncbi:UNVERIFIED_CONTAM: hypothetical protein RMT77_001971 [Armadillidium vulgare]
MTAEVKKWGKGEFWGIGSCYDPDWILTEEQKVLREKIIELCRVKIRPWAVQCDKTYKFPRESLNAMAELGLLSLITPKEFGGLGQNHVGAAMVVETIARYGCPSTAMVYTMHLGACATILFRYHNDKNIQDLLRRMDKEKLVGSLSYSDPATGGHIWFPMSSKIKQLSETTLRILKYASWTTSAGFADWYTIQTISPNFNGDYSDLSCFLVYKDEVRSSTDNWSAMGLHGNQSGPLVVDGDFPTDRLIGRYGEGRISNDEIVDSYFLLLASACWNGISMGCLDIAKKHVTRKAHADVGMRVCDYPTIQDYFGDCISSTNVTRSQVYFLADALDKDTNNNDWSLHVDPAFLPRINFLQWLWISKYAASKNVDTVSDTMLHACGGTGYKTDLGLERLLRDAKAGWVMGPSNEILRQIIGKISLLGFESVDFWEQNCNERILHHEINKMNLKSKRELAMKLLEEVGIEESGTNSNHPFQDTDFENPFNTCPPKFAQRILKGNDEENHGPGLHPDKWTSLSLIDRREAGLNMASFTFSLPKASDHTGCLPGQYVQVKANIDGKNQFRYLSPVSSPNNFGKIEFVIKFETQGIISNFFRSLKSGDKVDFKGPCGGFEYEPNKLEELTIIASGGGVTPGMQLIRCITGNPSDTTKINLIYYSDTFDDILYREELETLKAKDSRLRVYYTLGEVPENWDGGEGFIDTQMIDSSVTKPNGVKHKIVLCGGPTMVVSCLHSLKSLKFPSEMIFVYGQFGTEQVRMVYGRNIKLSGHTCDNTI